MNNSDKPKFAKAMARCYMAFDKPVNEQQLHLFFELLSEYSADKVVKAFADHTKDPDRGRFFPKPADIIYQIIGTEKQNSDNLTDLAEIEWAKIHAASSRGQEPANISIEARSSLRSLGGAQKVGYTLEKEIPFLKRDFIALFKSITKASSEQLDPCIPCYAELMNRKTQVVVK